VEAWLDRLLRTELYFRPGERRLPVRGSRKQSVPLRPLDAATKASYVGELPSVPAAGTNDAEGQPLNEDATSVRW
jgi:hypothetical protein